MVYWYTKIPKLDILGGTNMKRKNYVGKLLTGASMCLAMGASAVMADEYPSKTIEVVTHAGNGGGTDVTTRMMMLRARRELKLASKEEMLSALQEQFHALQESQKQISDALDKIGQTLAKLG